ncbi:MAG: methyltransferase domain-containing protein, partial [Alphaproteobacteria bacterium]|nr:methyltransferase domain-containing protein [Alphaproteobacteria bacterium]
MRWEPGQYLAFGDLRLRPAIDLLARVGLGEPALIYDLGCGPGNTTALLRRRWPDARIIGIDASAEMLAKARQASPDVDFRQADVAIWSPPEAPALIFSNAALHWLSDHHGLFPRLFGMLAPGGVLAVQMPRNFEQPSHRAMAEAVAGGPWAERLRPLLRGAPATAEPAVYWRLLAPLVAALEIFEIEYLQVLEGPDPVKEWTKGTALKPFLDALSGEERDRFEA